LSSKRSGRVLVGQAHLFLPDTLMEDWTDAPGSFGMTKLALRLRRLLRNNGHTDSPTVSTPSSENLLRVIREHYDRILLPYNLAGNHFIVFEVALNGPRGCYIKVWDGMMNWSGRRQSIPEIKILLDVFFDGHPIPIRHWNLGDPVQEKGYGCGPFAFLVLCHLAQGQLPWAWSYRDEGVARSFMWGCIMR